MSDNDYRCKFCGKGFVIESRFLAHRCQQMIRNEEIQTPLGQGAWSYYQKWHKAYRRMVPNAKSFLKSRKYTSFVKFAKFVKKMHIPNADLYILLMKEKDIDPVIWTSDEVYTLYVEFLDRRADPITQAKITIETIFKISDAADVHPAEIFDILEPNEVIEFFRRRQLSPWLMLKSSKFRDFFVNKMTSDQRIILETIIRPDYWTEKFKKHPKSVEQMKKYVSELNL